jgi:hypothetical protein
MSHAILPNVIIIGAMKAGTTSLYEYMAGHPEIGVSSEKETDFFIAEKNWGRGLDWYHGLFRPGFRVYAEASPNYTKRSAFAGVPERIRDTIPDCKFIFISRDPVARAESQYRHAVLSGGDVPAAADLAGSHELDHMIDTSRYHAQLAPYLDNFPQENFLFLRFEDLVNDPVAVLSQIAGFLAVADTWPAADSIETNSAASLARLPKWVFKLRETRIASKLKSVLPRAAITRAKSLLSRGPARTADKLPEEIRQQIARATVADSQNYERLARLSRSG